FFQAEDGIRDFHVTGVQTCALPISVTLPHLGLMLIGVLLGILVGVLPGLGAPNGVSLLLPLTFGMAPVSAVILLSSMYWGALFEIGRASCRERVAVSSRSVR